MSNSLSDAKKNNKPKYPVQTLEKAIEIINFFKTHPHSEGISLTELSEALNMGKSGVHRILDTLHYYNYIEQLEDTNFYKLGWELFEIGRTIPLQHSITNANYLPWLEKICYKYGETVNLGILNNYQAVIINKVEPTNPDIRLKVSIQVGGRGPLYVMSMGKLFLSDMPDDEVRYYYDTHKIEKLAINTITSPDEMIKELDTIRKNGYAVENQEYSNGLGCISMPIRNYTSKIVAAISLSGSIQNINKERIHEIGTDLKAACDYLSDYLGYKHDSK